jgi:hypothetical protein
LPAFLRSTRQSVDPDDFGRPRTVHTCDVESDLHQLRPGHSNVLRCSGLKNQRECVGAIETCGASVCACARVGGWGGGGGGGDMCVRGVCRGKGGEMSVHVLVRVTVFAYGTPTRPRTWARSRAAVDHKHMHISTACLPALSQVNHSYL